MKLYDAKFASLNPDDKIEMAKAVAEEALGKDDFDFYPFDVAQEKLRLAEKKLMQAAAKGTISKHAASRKVSRLTKRFNAAKAAKYVSPVPTRA